MGVVKDMAPQEMPDFAWSDVYNVRFANNSVLQRDGYTEILSDMSSTPSYVTSVRQVDNVSDLIVWFTQNNTTHVWDGVSATAAEITNASITGSSTVNAWTSTLLSGVLVATNGVDTPQRWVFPGDTSTLLVDLDNWTATHSCRIMRSFRQHLFALDTTEDGTRYPYRVKWSHPADPGTVPSSWDEGDPTVDAGTFDLIEGGDIIIDGLPLKDQFFIYKENSTWSARYVGGQSIWNFNQVFNGWGLMAKSAVCEANGFHYLVTRTDVLRHNGYDVESIANGRVRDYLIDNIAPTQIEAVRAVHHGSRQEVWFCFNNGNSSSGCNEALVWNYRFETWSIIDLPDINSICRATLASAADTETWDGEVLDSWNGGDVVRWDGTSIYPIDQLIWSSVASNHISRTTQDSYGQAGVEPACLIERTGFPLAGYRRMGEGPTVDTRVKYVKAIWPRVRVRRDGLNTDLNFYVGHRMTMADDVTWEGPYVFDATQDRKIDCRVTGREISIRMISYSLAGWILDSIDIEYDVDSRY